MRSCLLTNREVENLLIDYSLMKLIVNKDVEAGTIEVLNCQTRVFKAIQKGDKTQPWICTFYEE